jgi:hypothetical protein
MEKFVRLERFEKAFPEIPPVLPFSKGGVLLRNPQLRIPLFLPLEKGRCEKIEIFPLTLPSPARGISANLTPPLKKGGRGDLSRG